MLKFTFLTIFSLIFSLSAFADIRPTPIGEVISLSGKAFKLVPTVGIKRKRIELVKGMKLYELDIIATEKNSFVEVEMVDATSLTLSASSSFEIKKFSYIPGVKRETHYHQSWGALRARISKPTDSHESIQFNTKHVAVGVEESEFLSNSYSIGNKPTNDLLLIKGKVSVNVDQLNLNTKTFELREGTLFNSNILKERGFHSFPRIASRLLSFLKSSKNSFLPRLQKSNGRYVNINQELDELAFEYELLTAPTWTKGTFPKKWSRYFPLN